MPDLASTSKLVDLNVLDDDEALTLFTKVVGARARRRRAGGHRRTAAGLRGAAAGDQDLRGAAGHQERLDDPVDGQPAARRAPSAGRNDRGRPGGQAASSSLPKPRSARAVAPALAFCLLGLWHGPTISTAAAAALLGSSVGQAADALEILQTPTCSESGSQDYKFHDLPRVYASERAEADLPAADRDEAVRRLLSWYMRTADAAATTVSPMRYTLRIDVDPADPPALFYHRRGPCLVRRADQHGPASEQAIACDLHTIAAWRSPCQAVLGIRRGTWADCITTHRTSPVPGRSAIVKVAFQANNLGDAGVRSEAIGLLEESPRFARRSARDGEAQAANNSGRRFRGPRQA